MIVVEVSRILSDPCNSAAGLISAWDGRPANSNRLALVSDSASRPLQIQNRLAADTVAEVVAVYQSGATIKELVSRFEISRTTVTAHLRRAGIETRYRRLDHGQIEEAARLYTDGKSLARVGRQFEINAGTVRQALMKYGVAIRLRRGWKSN